jgi:Protein of unknown function (DUF2971)
MGPFSTMRDPRESHDWGLSASTYGGADVDDARRFVEFQREMSELKSRVKILSLTAEDPGLDTGGRDHRSEVFGRGFAHASLWEHYADNHRGVCLCLEHERLSELMREKLDHGGTLSEGFVEYEDGEIAPAAMHFILDEVRQHGVSAAVEEHVKKHLRELFFKKLADWDSEAEYRYVLQTADSDPVFVDVGGALRAVILGAAVPPVYLPALAELCDPSGIEIFQIYWLNGRPRLTPRRDRDTPPAVIMDDISFPAAPGPPPPAAEQPRMDDG